VNPEPDVVLGRRYALIRRIAVGGMGEVWEATDKLLGRQVAVKIMKEEFRTAPTFLARFRAEARHAGQLNHPGIAAVYDYGETDAAAFLVMELVSGRPLSELMVQQPALSAPAKLSILAQVADALQAAHEAGVVHRDVKPGNLMVRPDGTVKVTDFGIARALTSAPLTDHGQMIGTPAYVSPEQATGESVTGSSDIYSLGVVAYELFAGRPPFDRDTPLAVMLAHVEDLPPPLPDTVPTTAARAHRVDAGEGSEPPPGVGCTTRDAAASGDGGGGRGSDPGAPGAAGERPGRTHSPNSCGAACRSKWIRAERLHRSRDVPRVVGARRSDDLGDDAIEHGRRCPVGRRRDDPRHDPHPDAVVTADRTAADGTAAGPCRRNRSPPNRRPPNPTPVVPPSTAATVTRPAGGDPIAEPEAVAFIVGYYERVAAGDYEATWESLSPEFRDDRDLSFDDYVAYWERTTLEPRNLRFVPGPGDDQVRIRFDARYDTGTRVIDETDEITLRRRDDGTLTIIEQRTI
jgi:serine/threonine protein kinase